MRCRRFASSFLAFLSVVTTATMVSDQAGAGEEPPSRPTFRCEEIPLPETRTVRIKDIGIDGDGTLWVINDQSLLCLDGEKLVQPDTIAGEPNRSFDLFLGGGEGDLFAVRKARTVAGGGISSYSEPRGEILSLADRRAEVVTRFYYERTGSRPNVYRTDHGAFVCWGQRFVSIFHESKWQRIEVSRGGSNIAFIEGKDRTDIFCGTFLISVDGQGRFSRRELTGEPAPVSSPRGMTVGALWGETKAILLGLPNGLGGPRTCALYFLDLERAAFFEVPAVQVAFADRRICDVLPRPDGSVWILARSDSPYCNQFFRVAVDGAVTPIDETFDLGWGNNTRRYTRNATLDARDGAFWLIAPDSGLLRIGPKGADRFDWRQGLAHGGYEHICEGRDGTVFASSDSGLVAVKPGAPPTPVPDWVGRWTEYRIAGGGMLRDSLGDVWLRLKDRPGEISRWDGRQFIHSTLPVAIDRVFAAMADDRGRLLFEGWGENAIACRISREGITTYDNFGDALVAAVKDGTRRFYPNTWAHAPVVTAAGHIWRTRGGTTVDYFDGEAWDFVTAEHFAPSLHESAEYGVLFRSQRSMGRERFSFYDRGQLKALARSERNPEYWLLGPDLLQPYERELLDGNPPSYLPVEYRREKVERGTRTTMSLLVPHRNGESWARPEEFRRGDPMPAPLSRLTPGHHGGFWTSGSSHPPRRIFGARNVPVGECPSPLSGRERWIHAMCDDSRSDLWIYVGFKGGSWRIFRKDCRDFTIRASDIPRSVKRSLALAIESNLPASEKPFLRLFWRDGNGPWHAGDRGASLSIHFQRGGTHDLEIIGMDAFGALTPASLTFSLDVEILFPDTALTAEGPFRCDRFLWEAPVSALPSEDSGNPTIACRIAGGDWLPLHEGHQVLTGLLEPGRHRIEFAAVEEGRFYDPTPVVVDLDYAPDCDRILSEALAIIRKGDTEEKGRALTALGLIGESAATLVQERLLEPARRERDEAEAEFRQAQIKHRDASKKMNELNDLIGEIRRYDAARKRKEGPSDGSHR